MDLVDQKQDEAIHNIIKVYLAQVNSALKISNIICEHSGEDDENILSGDHIICGLIYRLMVPMTDEDMNESFNTADEILDGINDSSESDNESCDDLDDESEEFEKKTDVKRKLIMNDCKCDVCSKCRECINGYESYETYDPLVTRFKDSIKDTCEKHHIYIN